MRLSATLTITIICSGARKTQGRRFPNRRRFQRALGKRSSRQAILVIINFYNDQFYANAQGQVTYRNGTVVFVPPTFSAANPTVAPGTPNAMISGIFTGVYTFSDGRLRGLRAGGTANLAWKNRKYYYYPNGVTVDGDRELFTFRTQVRFDLLLGYERRIGRYSLGTQINVSNIFNRYRVVITPNAVTGWAGPNNALLDAAPRVWTWSTTLGF